MTYALVIVEKPQDRALPLPLVEALREENIPEGTDRLNEYSLLISLENNAFFFSKVMEEIRVSCCTSHIAFFDQKPTFISPA